MMDRSSGCMKSWRSLVAGAACGIALLASSTTFANTPVNGAAFTTTNTTVDGTGHCKNGNEAVNCNIYDGKTYVWMNGGPVSAGLGDGTYFFAVLAPGGQSDANDGSPDNLSDDFDAYTNRTFTLTGGTIGPYAGTHDFAGNKIRLAPYIDTTNPGGVYILAICSLADGYPVDASDCKYDAFKVLPANAFVVKACKFNDANGDGIKDGDEPLLANWVITGTGVLNESGVQSTVSLTTDEDGCAAFTVGDRNAAVTFTETSQNGWLQTAPFDTGTYGGYTGSATGVATLTTPIAPDQVVYFGNYNLFEGGNIDVTKTASPRAEFTLSIAKSVDKTSVTKAYGSATFNYTVNVSHGSGTWTVYGDITISNTTSLTVPNVKVVDTIDNNGTCTVKQSGSAVTSVTVAPGSTPLTYNCTFASPLSFATTGTNAVSLQVYDSVNDEWVEIAYNTASYSFAALGIAGAVDGCVNVTDSFAGTLGTVCADAVSPVSFTYSRTIAVQSGCHRYDNTATFTTDDSATTGSDSETVTVCGPINTGAKTIGFWQNKNGQTIIVQSGPSSGTCNATTWLRTYAPFQDLPATASCSALATYVFNVIKAASSAGTSMNPMLKAQMLATALDVYFSSASLGGNKIGAPQPLGDVTISLTNICKDIGTCNTLEDVSGAFGGATTMTVTAMLSYAAGQSNVGGSAWYGQVKATQEKAKDAFDAINNQVAFAP
jgi:hypothetical protein